MPLGDGGQRRYVKFDPTLNTGHLVQIIVLVVGGFAAYGAVKSEQAENKAGLEQVKAVALVERTQTTQTLAEIKSSVSKLQESNQDIKESLAILRGRAADQSTRGNRP